MRRFIFFMISLLLLFPNTCFAEELVPNGKSAILIEAGSGRIVFQKSKDEQLSVASLTKMVAQIIILEEIEKGSIHWEDVVTISRNASNMGGSQIYLEEGEKISVRDLMKGISIASGNDAVVAMAEYISGSEEAFVDRMNQVVRKLKLQNTHFVNCTGLDEEGHYSSSYDMAMIARELLLKHPAILDFSSVYEDYLRENTNNKFWLVNTNKLIRFYEGADGLKTGHTDNAGYCLAATAKRGNLRLIGIVLGEENSKVRNQELMDLLDYGFQNVQMNCFMKKGTVVGKTKIDMASSKTITAVLQDDLCIMEDKGQKKSYDYHVSFDDISLPISKNQKVGLLEVLSNGKPVTTVDIVSSSDISKISLISFYTNTLWNYISGVF